MESRQNFSLVPAGSVMQPVEGSDRMALAASPILSAGDICGAIMFLDDGSASAAEADIKLIATAAAFLGRQMEE